MKTKVYQRTIEGTNKRCQFKFTIGFDMDIARRYSQDPYFSITGDTWELGKPKTDRNSISGGALKIGEYLPELAHLDKYHLMSTKEPMHYISNALYHTSKRDHNKLLKGEKQFKDEYTLRFADFPFSFKIKSTAFNAALKETTDWNAWTVQAVEHVNSRGETYKFSHKYTLKNSVGELLNSEWYKCEFDEEQEAQEMLTALQTLKWSYVAEPVLYRIGEGKEIDLAGARVCACWPEANIEDFTEEKLKARLPELMKQFRKDIEAAGILWPEDQKSVAV